MQENLSVEIPATEIRIVELEQWIRPPEPTSEIALEVTPPAEQQRTFTEPAFLETAGVPLAELIQQRSNLPTRGRRRIRVVPDEQGVLFSVQ
jgi:hypothetical protein